MDGVVANFQKRYEELFNVDVNDTSRFYLNIRQFVDGNNFSTLEDMHDAQDLIKYLTSLPVPVEILSSSGCKQNHDDVYRQKIHWLSIRESYNFIKKINIVPGSCLKYRYALSKWHILIDDTKWITDDFNKAGGTGIHHTSAANTIKQLKKLHYEWTHPVDSII